MDQEQLIRQITSEAMKPLGNDSVSFARNAPAPAAPAQAPAAGTRRIGRDEYPLAEKHLELVKTNTGKALDELTSEDVKVGKLSPPDFRIFSEILELQAQVVDTDGRRTLVHNLCRAAEPVAVPNARLLEVYNALRSYRSMKAELYEIADELEGQYGAKVSAGFVREAADVYEARGRLREDRGTTSKAGLSRVVKISFKAG